MKIKTIIGAISSMIMASELPVKPSDLEWNKTWDFKARDLDLSLGTPSSVSVLTQPKLSWIEFFGFLGHFPGETEGKLVGFAQISTKEIKLTEDISQITVTARTHTPGIEFRLFLSYPKEIQKCNYQANFKPSLDNQQFIFTPEDFECFFRGNPVAVADPVDFSKVEKVGFLVTKSSQDESISKKKQAFAFSLIVSEIK